MHRYLIESYNIVLAVGDGKANDIVVLLTWSRAQKYSRVVDISSTNGGLKSFFFFCKGTTEWGGLNFFVCALELSRYTIKMLREPFFLFFGYRQLARHWY